MESMDVDDELRELKSRTGRLGTSAERRRRPQHVVCFNMRKMGLIMTGAIAYQAPAESRSGGKPGYDHAV
jgi:hypothetical protein